MTDRSGGLGDTLRDANLHGADLRRRDLRGADLSGTDLSEADLRRADLRGADLRNADLSGADLRHADLRGVTLDGADLAEADLRNTTLTGVDAAGTTLSDVGIARAHPTGVSPGTKPLAALLPPIVVGTTLALSFSLLFIGWSGWPIVAIVGFALAFPVSVQFASWYESRAENGDPTRSAETSGGRALDRLRERYAEGDIDETEFERRVERLLETESAVAAEREHADVDPSAGDTAVHERETETDQG